VDDQPKLTRKLPLELVRAGWRIETISRWGGMPMFGPKKWNAPLKISLYCLISPDGVTAHSNRLLKNVLEDAPDVALAYKVKKLVEGGKP